MGNINSGIVQVGSPTDPIEVPPGGQIEVQWPNKNIGKGTYFSWLLFGGAPGTLYPKGNSLGFTGVLGASPPSFFNDVGSTGETRQEWTNVSGNTQKIWIIGIPSSLFSAIVGLQVPAAGNSLLSVTVTP